MSLIEFKKWYDVHRARILKEYFHFLRFRSISTDPAYSKEMFHTVDWLKTYLAKIGLEVEVWETPSYPLIFASECSAGPSCPTLLLYHHYDVQPVDPIELWVSDPFEPEVREGAVYARGALDNKGQCFYSLTAVEAFLQLVQQRKLNIKVFIEGEEESGSAGTTSILEGKKEALKADYMLVVDFDLPAPDLPALTLGMRGITALEVECIASGTDLHSGTHGGIALNPNRALATALSRLWDAQGKIAIPGFYDDVEECAPKEKSLLDLSFDEKEYQEMFGVKAFAMEKGISATESNTLRPSLEINGMSGGYTGKGFKTIIPAKAVAKLSCRTVPYQCPEQVAEKIAAFLKRSVPSGIEMKVHTLQGAPAYRTCLDSPLIKMVASAFEEVFQKPCRYLLCGASVPIIAKLAPLSGADAIMMGCGLASDNIHAPNEHFGLDRFEKGFLTVAMALSRLSVRNGSHDKFVK